MAGARIFCLHSVRLGGVSRDETDAPKVERLMEALGRRASGPGAVYFTGGASAVLLGWRTATVDADLLLDPEPAGVFEAIAHIKDELSINIELASPADFTKVERFLAGEAEARG